MCRLLELGINQLNIFVVIAGENSLHGLRRLIGERFQQTKKGAVVVLHDTEA